MWFPITRVFSKLRSKGKSSTLFNGRGGRDGVRNRERDTEYKRESWRQLEKKRERKTYMLIAPSKFRSRAMIVLLVTTEPGAQKSTIAPCRIQNSKHQLLVASD